MSLKGTVGFASPASRASAEAFRQILHTGLCVLGCATFTGPLAGQAPQRSSAPATGRIVGSVVDASSGVGVAGVVVRLLPPAAAATLTGEDGRFSFSDVPAEIQELEVERIGYATRTHLVNVPAGRTVLVTVELVEEAIELGSIRVRVELRSQGLEEAGYYDRRRLGFGHYFEVAELERSSFVVALRQVPRLELAGRGSFHHTPYFRNGIGSCVPVIWIDRRMFRLRGMSLESMIDVNSIAAMEVYTPGDTPGEFMYGLPDCGAIVIWSRALDR